MSKHSCYHIPMKEHPKNDYHSLFFFYFFPGALGRGQKSLNFITKSISKIFFLPNFVCVLTNERYKTYQMGYFVLMPGSCPRGGLWGQQGMRRGSKKLFFRTWSCGISY